MKYRFDEVNHIHFLDNKSLYGTSTVCKVISKSGGLVWWASGKALEPLGWTPTKMKKEERTEKAKSEFQYISTMSIAEYLELLDKAYRNHKDSLDKSADEGTDLHAELERFVKWKMKSVEQGVVLQALLCIPKQIQPFIDWSEKNVKRFLWSEAHSYDEDTWTGGISDAGALLNNGEKALIDFKSAKEAYFSHFVQVAGYCIQIEKNGLFDKDGNEIETPKPSFSLKQSSINKFLVVPFGAKEVVPIENTLPINELKDCFKSAVQLYKSSQKTEKL
jgi:hypothetical protein